MAWTDAVGRRARAQGLELKNNAGKRMAVRCGALRGVFVPAVLAACGLGFGAHACAAEEQAAMPEHVHAAPEAMDAAPHHHDGDLLLFPNVTGNHRNVPVSDLKQDELLPELNIFYSTDHERLRFLAEFLLNRDEHEVERLQLGWLVQPTTTAWMGRFHNLLGFWNTEHHHGAYMQTTISRPAILAFEDEGGVLPTHVTGLLAEGALDRDRGAVNYAFALGKGPKLEGTTDLELEPMYLPQFSHGGKLAASARLSLRPGDDGANEFGAFAGYTEIPLAGSVFHEADQTVAGVFYTTRGERLRLIGELFYVSNRLTGPVPADRAEFGAGYLQAEYLAHADWTLFGRFEDTSGVKNNAYLQLFPEFLDSRAMVGARFEVASHQALKLELSRNERQDAIRFNQVSLQWSMVYP